MKHSRRYRELSASYDKNQSFSLHEAVAVVKRVATAKADESIDVAMRLGIDSRHADQQVRGTVILPHGTGRTVRVLVLAKGEYAKEAEAAGANFVGAEEMVEKIQGGWLDFDRVVATPDLMGQVGRLGRVLGPRGLMPNPKLGTVTFEVGRVVGEIKSGKVDFRAEKAGIVQSTIGRASMDTKQLEENLVAFVETIFRLKPSAAKGRYLKSMCLSPTMGPGVRVDPVAVGAEYV
ncbi:MAG: 50S ribosomal protein L1 [Nitrospirae bacterium CG06_land_8_20_14_3_00_70_43]|nr:MAG: 50S ribosomal protein L1 [Nitrospirae bacterium CG06_land_8_20_14_3_00_70_43]